MKQKRLEFNFLRRESDELSILQQRLKSLNAVGATAQVVFVKGLSGTGKSSFVKASLEKKNTDALYTAAKFDQRGSSVPFSALRSVLSGLCNQITKKQLIEDCKREVETEVPRSHQKLLTSLAPHVTRLLPKSLEEDEEQEDSSASNVASLVLSGEEGLNVVKLALRSLFRAISRVSSVIICMDDIMWSDQTTLDILQSILTDSQLKQVLFCFIYRSNEVDESHHLVPWQKELEKQIENVDYITIENLELPQVEKLLSSAMRLDIEPVADLAKILHERTHGNIFYILQLMEKLQDMSLISYDIMQGRWTWNIREIENKTSISENVVELVSSRIENLPPQVQSVLKLASCLGARFDVQILETIKDVFDIESVHSCLEEAKDLDLLIELDEHNYKFAHDTIQFAASSLLPKGKDMTRLNWDIGHLLLQSQHIKDNRTMFACASQFIKALEFIDGDAERVKIAELFLSVGSNAMALSAFVRASTYFKAGLDALGNSPFDINYSIALKLFSSYGKTEYCAGNLDESKRVAELIVANAKVGDDQLDAHIILFTCLFTKGNTMEGIDYALKFLGQLGESVPKNPTSRQLKREYQSMKKELKGMSDDDILRLPFTEDRAKTAYIKIIFDLIKICFAHNLMSLIEFGAMRMVRSTLKDGMTTFSPLALALAGSYFIACKTDVKEGYRFGEIARKLTEKPSFAISKCRTLMWVGSFTRATVVPLSQCLDTLLEGHKAGMLDGDLSFAYNSITGYCYTYFYSGLPLTPLLQDMEDFCLQMLEYKQNLVFFMNVPLWQCLLNLCGRSKDPCDIENGYAMDKLNAMENPTKMSDSMNSYQMQISFYLGNLDKARELMDKLKNLQPGMRRATVVIWTRYFFFALIAIANFRRFKKRKYKSEAKTFIKEMEHLVKAGVINIAHRLQILEAEFLSLTCKDCKKVYHCYQDAIKSATRTGFVQDAALVNYLCSQYCSNVKDDMAMQEMEHLCKSRELWMTWGATAVADSLEQRHPSKFSNNALSSKTWEMSGSIGGRSGTGSMGGGGPHGSTHRGKSRFDKTAYSAQITQLDV